MDIIANSDKSINIYIYTYILADVHGHMFVYHALHSNEFVAILTLISTSKMVQFHALCVFGY